MSFVLNTRERLILKEVINGETNNFIAKKLFLSHATVKAQISNLIQKLNAKNRVQLAIFGMYFLMDQISFDDWILDKLG